MHDEAPLIRSMEACRERALVALTEQGSRTAEAVAWLSAHVAAVEHVLGPRIRRVLGPDAGLAEQRHETRDLLLRLRVLEQVAAGRPIPPGASLRSVRDVLLEAFVAHAATNDRLVRELLERISEEDARQLAVRYADAVRRGPTRPHLHSVRPEPLEAIRFTVDRIRDQVLDILDARQVPRQRPPGTPERQPTRRRR